jgi:N-acetylglucosamine-6-phosphate deacetylase
VEGPFISEAHNGIHNKAVIQLPVNGFSDLAKCYGANNLERGTTPIRYITIAPELPGALSAIRELKARGITVSIGHSDASYEEAKLAMEAGATMVTHCFNA